MNRRSGEASKKRILAAASKVFPARGYRGASMRAIAGAADISIGGLYLYFRNKEDLYTTLVRNQLDDLTAATKEALRDIRDPAERMRTLISTRVEYAKKHREMILVLGREQTLTFGLKAKKKFFDDQRGLLEEIIRTGIAAGRFRRCDEKEVAKIIVCVLRGFILSMLVEPDAMFSPGECSTLILNGLLAEQQGA